MRRHQKEFEQYLEDWKKHSWPWRLWQLRSRPELNEDWSGWRGMDITDVVKFGDWLFDFRRKPETIKIGDYDLPKPITEEPEEEKLVYFFAPKYPSGFIPGRYCKHSQDVNYFNNRCIHLTEESVLEWVKWWKETVIDKLEGSEA